MYHSKVFHLTQFSLDNLKRLTDYPKVANRIHTLNISTLFFAKDATMHLDRIRVLLSGIVSDLTDRLRERNSKEPIEDEQQLVGAAVDKFNRALGQESDGEFCAWMKLQGILAKFPKLRNIVIVEGDECSNLPRWFEDTPKWCQAGLLTFDRDSALCELINYVHQAAATNRLLTHLWNTKAHQRTLEILFRAVENQRGCSIQISNLKVQGKIDLSKLPTDIRTLREPHCDGLKSITKLEIALSRPVLTEPAPQRDIVGRFLSHMPDLTFLSLRFPSAQYQDPVTRAQRQVYVEDGLQSMTSIPAFVELRFLHLKNVYVADLDLVKDFLDRHRHSLRDVTMTNLGIHSSDWKPFAHFLGCSLSLERFGLYYTRSPAPDAYPDAEEEDGPTTEEWQHAASRVEFGDVADDP
ncbi:Hypothetical predicted protein [Lecanosticta acicola]|uniref:Uncharacterized protein n=1 Tax=Lecanosticta acicola TaxID=111012 RepID=A0AAI8Z6R0_9PEZI|nr:Hypothetical predicted protein [Lecanosticta acicola]